MNRRAFLASSVAASLVPLFARAAASRVLCLGGSLTEIAFALGAGDRLVARDTTSAYPAAALALPDVGYLRALSAEGVLAIAPDLILAEPDAGPPEVVDVLKKSGVKWVSVGDNYTPEAIISKVLTVGAELGLPDRAAILAAALERDLAALAAKSESIAEADRRRVLFILSAEGGKILAGGAATSANGIIAMAGGVNVATGFDGYKPMTDEAVLAANPDVILMMDRGGDHSAANSDLFALPALASSSAAKADAVIRMDGLYLLGFGPRAPQAALNLHTAFYG